MTQRDSAEGEDTVSLALLSSLPCALRNAGPLDFLNYIKAPPRRCRICKGWESMQLVNCALCLGLFVQQQQQYGKAWEHEHKSPPLSPGSFNIRAGSADSLTRSSQSSG